MTEKELEKVDRARIANTLGKMDYHLSTHNSICVGCPFNSKVGEDLFMIEKHEPKTVKVCMNIFGESYRLMDEFQIHNKKNNESLRNWLEYWDSKEK